MPSVLNTLLCAIDQFLDDGRRVTFLRPEQTRVYSGVQLADPFAQIREEGGNGTVRWCQHQASLTPAHGTGVLDLVEDALLRFPGTR